MINFFSKCDFEIIYLFDSLKVPSAQWEFEWPQFDLLNIEHRSEVSV